MALTPETFQNLERDIEDTGKAVNTDSVVDPRYGLPFKSLPMVSRLFEAMIASGYLAIDDLQTAIDIALEAGAGAAGWTADLISYSGTTQKEFNDLSKFKLVSIFDFMTMDQFKTWKSNQETFNVTFALQAAINAPGVTECLLPAGTYLYSGVYCDKHNFKLYSNAGATLLSDDSASVAFHIAKFAKYIQGVQLDGIVFKGNENTLRGAQLGDSTNAAIFTKIRNCIFTGFSNSNACDIYLGSVQELDIQDTKSWNGNIGIYKAVGGYGTSTRIHGKNSYFGRHAKHGIKLDGQIDDIYIQDSVIEGNGLEALKITNTAFKGTQGVSLYIDNAYFEENGITGGNGVIHIVGKSDSDLTRHVVNITGCNFASNETAGLSYLDLNCAYTNGSVSNSRIKPSNIDLLENSCSFAFSNNKFPNSNKTQDSYRVLAAKNNIIVDDWALKPNTGDMRQFTYRESITFPAVNIPINDPNTLDDYEEGTYTPTISGNGGTFTTVTGRYTKVGNLVTFFISIVCQNFTSTFNTTQISLPMSNLTIGAVAMLVNNQTGNGGNCLLTGDKIKLPTLTSQGTVATLYITGSYQTTL